MMTPEKQAAFRRVQASFVERLHRERRALQCLAAQLPDPSRAPAPEWILAVNALAHGLAGAAGTFGFAQVGQVAARLDACTGRSASATLCSRASLKAATLGLIEALDEALKPGMETDK